MFRSPNHLAGLAPCGLGWEILGSRTLSLVADSVALFYSGINASVDPADTFVDFLCKRRFSFYR